ncbi:hypothetical protein ABBQ32_006529 [Trebouxia sp. C0010 RCD-2024]
MPFLFGVCFAWLVLHAIAAVLKHLCGCESLGIGLFSISVQTNKCNRLFYKFGRQHNAALRQWYSFGVAVAAMLGMSVIFMLLQDVWLAAVWIRESMSMGPDIAPGSRVPLAGSPGSQGGFAMGLAVPGLTVPWAHAGYLWIATAASIAIHEAGHALAAASEGVGVQNVGAFTLLLLPGAYVALDSGALATLGPWRTLRVVCAGVWHNAVLCALCWLCALLLPLLLLPLYTSGTGAVVRAVSEGGPLSGQLEAGDNIWMLNQCPVTSSRSWLACLASSNLHDAAHAGQKPRGGEGEGYCVPQSMQQSAGSCAADGPISQCAGNSLCFMSEAQEGSLEKWASAFASRRLQAGRRQSGSCLHARSAAACPPCSTTRGGTHNPCPDGAVCMSPVVSPGEHMFKVCFHPSSTSGDARWLPGQASAIGRKMLGLQQTAGLNAAQANWLGAQRQTGDSQRHLQGVNTTEAHQGLQEGAAQQQSVAQAFPQAAFMAAHPGKHTVKLTAGSLTAAQSLQQNSSDPVQQPYAESRAVPDRIGRVALANEHRKVIRQGSSPPESLRCTHYLIYVGTSGQLMQALDVSDFDPRSSFIPLQWPHLVEQMLVYTFAVSAALALVNMAPIWYLDGEAALSSAVKLRGHSDIFYSSVSQPNRHWGRLLRCVLGVGSCIFVCVLVLHMVRLLGYDAKLGQHLHTLGKLLSFVMT